MKTMEELKMELEAEDLQELEEEEWEEVSAEDYIEWCAASVGMTVNEYLGKPWLD